MPLRSPNNPNTSKVIMGVLQNILPANTQLAATSISGTGLELVYIQQKYKMALNMTDTIPIAVNIEVAGEERMRESQRSYTAILPIEVGYYSRWDDQNSSIDAIWDSLDTDIERMIANVENNDDTEYQGTNHTISLEKIVLSPYADQKDETFIGLTLIKRIATIYYNVLPYGT